MAKDPLVLSGTIEFFLIIISQSLKWTTYCKGIFTYTGPSLGRQVFKFGDRVLKLG